MRPRIEDYALLGDCQSAALVATNGSIDWLCLPRFDSDACFASLVGTEENGFWRIAPLAPVRHTTRAYRNGSLMLETELTTDEGTIVLVDFMAVGEPTADLVRLVVGKSGRVCVRMDLVLRAGYGRTIPWVQRFEHEGRTGIEAIAGPDRFRLTTTPAAPLRGEGFRTVTDFVVRAGDRVPFVFDWSPSHVTPLPPVDPHDAFDRCERFWCEWSSKAKVEGRYADVVKRSLITLKALTYAPTGGIVAAPTTSLPEQLRGVRNWDYRFCWVRDATFTLYSLLSAGYTDEARAWRDWVMRAAAGAPAQLQILYGIAGERRLTECELGWLGGYERSRPVRIGNLASEQLQLDVYGELLDTLHLCTCSGLASSVEGWALQRALVCHLENVWTEPDCGIWEVRGPTRHFTHSKVMCWVAFDRAVKSIEKWGLDGPLERWRTMRARIHADICANGFDASRRTFVQYYGGTEPDASLLRLPLVGFLPPDDPRIICTVEAIQRLLVKDGLVQRYVSQQQLDGLPAGEGSFLACSFWLVDALVLMGRTSEATILFERLLGLTNDLGLLSEEYDVATRRMLGNFPQALSHVALVNTALNLSRLEGPAHHRRSM
jgi:GH15 family glucan-1,4-alpha-glucosidase